MIVYGWKMAAMQVESDQSTIILQIPLVYLYAILPLMGVLMVLRLFILYYREFAVLHAAKLTNQPS